MLRRSVGSPALFAIVWTSVASAIYFSLGVVVDHALGLTPVVFLVAGVYFALTAMTYVEGSSLHQERAGSTVFARYAFNELWSFIAGWAVLLDFLIVIAVTTFAATNYLGVFWGELDDGVPELIVAIGIIAYVAVRNLRGAGRPLYRPLVVADVALQLLLIVIGLAQFLDVEALTASIDLGSRPTWGDFVFALTVSTVALTSLESAAGLAGELAIGRRGLKRMLGSATGGVLVFYTGIALVAVSALTNPSEGDVGAISLESPVADLAGGLEPGWLGETLVYVVGALATVTLVAACNAAMLGLSRLAYSLATNRQIPGRVGRLHPRWGTPWVVIAIAAVLACALVVPQDLEFLVGIYAFGALLAFLIAHVAICVLRYREPDRRRPYRMRPSVRVGGGDLPLPAVAGAVLSAGAFVSLVVSHEGARYLGIAWMAVGLALYVGYRRTQGKSLTKRVVVPEAALRVEAPRAQYGSILVPLFGNALDDDIVQTAGRLAADEHADEAEGAGATIEALWVFEIPLSLPLDAPLPEAQFKRARAALARAKAVGEEYEGVEVATATVRARRAGEAIVTEAIRRGVELIVLAAEEPSRIRGGARLGGIGGPLENFLGDATKYVVRKAPCRVILTAPPSEEVPAQGSPAEGRRQSII